VLRPHRKRPVPDHSRPFKTSAMKSSVKNLLGQAIFAARLDEILLANAAVVVAFHNIQDTIDSWGLTVGADLFERFCRFFMRHFHVVPLKDVVHRLERRLPLERRLAITFDDGYRDNFENAVPVLEKLSLPATFFVVSDWIGSDVVPWWDRERGVRHAWMTWDQVRLLRRKGFDIGGHTRTHVDLGTVGPRRAKEEILGARHELEKQLDGPVELFAYPYGRRDNLAEANRDVVKAAGFRCCCSSFGGVNVPGTDPFHLMRIPISPWYASPGQFGFDLALGRSVLSQEGRSVMSDHPVIVTT
jgi:peptidoglycan/xylan/chitin deacetylase (PgdA/CDA1 family)